MANIITSDDFVGEYVIPKNCFSELQRYIDKYEDHYLVRLLGAELYNLFIADLTNGVPSTQRFLDIFNSFKIDDHNCLRISEGIKQMLVQFIYFHIVRDLGVKKSIGGVTVFENEVSSQSMYSGFNIVESFNEGVDNWLQIQWFICDNDDLYPEENGEPTRYMNGI